MNECTENFRAVSKVGKYPRPISHAHSGTGCLVGGADLKADTDTVDKKLIKYERNQCKYFNNLGHFILGSQILFHIQALVKCIKSQKAQCLELPHCDKMVYKDAYGHTVPRLY